MVLLLVPFVFKVQSKSSFIRVSMIWLCRFSSDTFYSSIHSGVGLICWKCGYVGLADTQT